MFLTIIVSAIFSSIDQLFIFISITSHQLAVPLFTGGCTLNNYKLLRVENNSMQSVSCIYHISRKYWKFRAWLECIVESIFYIFSWRSQFYLSFWFHLVEAHKLTRLGRKIGFFQLIDQNSLSWFHFYLDAYLPYFLFFK